MVAVPSNGFHQSLWRSNCLSPREEQELDFDHLGEGLVEVSSGDGPPWEAELVSRIRALSATEKSLVLETVSHYLEERGQGAGKEQVWGTEDVAIRELLEPWHLVPQQTLEQTFLFHLSGLVLRECDDTELVKSHLAHLLELPHQPCSQREGIALAVGLTSASHLEDVWAALEHLGRTRFLRSALCLADGQQPDSDLHWKWVSSTVLLCYGQVALHAREQVLPWVDSLASRMVYYFSCSSYDSALKTSFLAAAVMLVKALRREAGTQSYKFMQTPELIRCLLCILQREPNFLATPFRQKIILVIVGLSNLRPCLKPTVKSTILQTCLKSLYTLPPLELPDSSLPPQDPAPDVMALYQKTMCALDLLLQTFISENKSMDEVCFLLQHAEPWLKSDEGLECRRAVQSISLLLQYVADVLKFTEEATPSMLGHQIGLLTLLWRDKDEVTRNLSCQCVHLLLQLLVLQKGRTVELPHVNRLKQWEVRGSREWQAKLYHTVKAFNETLTVAQHTQLVLSLLHGLGSHGPLRCDLASQLLLTMFQEPGVKPEQVAEVLQGLFRELPGIVFKGIRQTVMQAVSALGARHTQETVEVVLCLGHPSERQVLPLWKALATTPRLTREVVTQLYMKLKLRPPRLLGRSLSEFRPISLLALGTIYELLYVQEFRATVRWAFAGILLGLLTQLHYLFELGLLEDISDYPEDTLETKPLSPCRTCLEALKGLFWTTSYWEVFAHLKLLSGWELLEHPETYTDGVTLLARAMAQYNCEVKAVLGQAAISLKSTEERENVAAILIITEFLSSPEVFQHVSRRAVDNCLSLSLSNSSQLVRAMSLKGLSSTLMHPKKVALLRSQLLGLLDSFLKPEPKDITGLMEVLSHVLHRLGTQGDGAVSVKIAQHLLPLFEDEREEVRAGAIFLFGDVVYSGGKKFRQTLKGLAFQALVPLLLHQADPCPKVVMKAKFTFLRCAILLKWEFRKELSSKLAWGRGPGAENDIFIYMVESNFSSCQQFLMQALTYLDSPLQGLKLAAMKFIGGMLQDYFTDLCFYLKKGDVKILQKSFETLREDQDSVCRKFYLSFLADVMELSQYVT
ncbi:maestro heat-like repeat family member 5 isoform X2 [Tupaia chinensis]|uniref:maestro heat-like repeat family member 5 isoform X2 n=1 Tax=Tupaia chinensis TaxID=246437 RepID=UPI0003C8E54D|nr:maestro heat-like repeat family member 5 isoform X2 [Tupaia chinensis]